MWGVGELWRRRATALASALLLSGASGCEPANRNAANGRDPAASISAQPVGAIDSDHPSISIPLASLAQSEGQRFVAVEVREVINPSRVPLTFEVAFRPVRGDPVRLGEFSLFPPDNPGRFIVATQGRVAAPGSIVVSLAEGDRAAARNVRVVIGAVALTDR